MVARVASKVLFGMRNSPGRPRGQARPGPAPWIEKRQPPSWRPRIGYQPEPVHLALPSEAQHGANVYRLPVGTAPARS
jgi:hypothetical protein